MAKSYGDEIDDDGKAAPKRRFDKRDFDYVAEYVIEEYHKRKKDRSDREKEWADIDRQIAMQPEVAYKKLSNGEMDPGKVWMSEIELPLQSTSLEVQTADCRRLMFVPNGSWYRANVALTDEYLREVDFKSIILGDEMEVPSQINQDGANKLAESFLLRNLLQKVNEEDFFTRMDRITAEAIKYGIGVGRGRLYKKTLYSKMKSGVRKEDTSIPVLVPCSIKNLYLDTPKPSTHSVQLLEPAHIAVDHIKLANLQMAASRGSTDPDDEDGGWMPQAIGKLVPDDNGYVTLLEMEGDIVVPRKTTRSMVLPGCIITVALGASEKSGGAASRAVVRFRWRADQDSSYFLFPYHFEGAEDIYATCPLMKGRPVQIGATGALNRCMDSAALKNAPPVGYDRNDQLFAQEGGPRVHPYAMWGTLDAVKVHAEVGGDPSAMAAAMMQLIALYGDLSGVLPARLGAQTVSHTTAFAKDAELNRGASRTVDYVNSAGNGALTRWLGTCYRMGRDALGSNTAVFEIPAYGGWVEVTREQLPELVNFEWFGAGGPREEAVRRQNKMQSLGFALQMDQMGAAYGRPPKVNLEGAQREILRDGGWTDLDAVLSSPQPPQPAPMEGPAMAAVASIPKLIASQ